LRWDQDGFGRFVCLVVTPVGLEEDGVDLGEAYSFGAVADGFDHGADAEVFDGAQGAFSATCAVTTSPSPRLKSSSPRISVDSTICSCIFLAQEPTTLGIVIPARGSSTIFCLSPQSLPLRLSACLLSPIKFRRNGSGLCWGATRQGITEPGATDTVVAKATRACLNKTGTPFLIMKTTIKSTGHPSRKPNQNAPLIIK
jgi:hypothetical protein